jgi:short-subunit dehydrogenase
VGVQQKLVGMQVTRFNRAMKNNWVLITGASSGIGAALAEEYAGRGCSLILLARREQRLLEVKHRCQLRRADIEVQTCTADVTAENFAQTLESLVKNKSLVLAIANAGFGSAGSFEKLSLGDYRRVFETNVFGVIKTLQAVLPALKAGRGRAAVIGSLNAYTSLPLGAPYNMSKFAVRALAESLYCEFEEVGISLVNPGPVKTEILSINNSGQQVTAKDAVKVKGALSAEKAARRIAKGLARGKREIFLSWDTALVAFFFRHFPSLSLGLTRFVFRKKRSLFTSLVAKVNPDSV